MSQKLSYRNQVKKFYTEKLISGGIEPGDSYQATCKNFM